VYRNDPALVQACLAGEKTAWNELVGRYSRLVYSIPVRYGLSRDDADDIFQNVFTIVLRQLAQLRDQRSLSAWLITITHHECQHWQRRTARTQALSETIEDTHPTLPEHAQTQERQRLVHEALQQLDVRCRELLTALFLVTDPPSYAELAKQLGIGVGSIGPTRARCIKKLESSLLAKGFTPTD
jgi:RNA polymerase sigma factor (sigma-70 family)